MNFAILIPSYQPDNKLITLINALIGDDFLKKFPIIVIDDGSGDRYKKIFSEIENYVHLIRYQQNRGKGFALKTGFTYILNELNLIDAVVTIDGDGQHTIKDTVKCLKSYEKNNKLKPIILGSRNFEDNVPLRSKFGNLMTRDVLSFSMGLNVSDTQTGLRVIPMEYLKKLLELKGERYEYEMQMLLFAQENNIRLIEVPIDTIYIDENDSSHFDPIKDSLKIYSTFLKFIISSSSSFIVDISVFTLLIYLLKNYSTNSIFLASFLSRFMSSLFNFFMNKAFVFKKGDKTSLIKYFLLVIIQITLSASLVTITKKVLLQINVTLIKLVVDIFLFIFSYYIQKKYIFTKHSENKIV